MSLKNDCLIFLWKFVKSYVNVPENCLSKGFFGIRKRNYVNPFMLIRDFELSKCHRIEVNFTTTYRMYYVHSTWEKGVLNLNLCLLIILRQFLWQFRFYKCKIIIWKILKIIVNVLKLSVLHTNIYYSCGACPQGITASINAGVCGSMIIMHVIITPKRNEW